MLAHKQIIVRGQVENTGFRFHALRGTVVLNGTSQNLRMNAGDYCNNLTFNQSGTLTINNTLSNVVKLNGSLQILSGVFNMQDRVMHVAGNNDQVFSVHHAEFSKNTWGDLYNVSKT